MKNKKRLFSLILALTLCVTIAFAALAEGKLLAIWNAGSALLFETDNVSLTGHATFTYDGELFKTFDGRYRQDGSASYMQVMLDTPMEDGSVYTGGYTVVADGGVSYAIETQRPQYYLTSSCSLSPSILTNTAVRSSLMRFGGLLLDLMEDRMADAVTATQHDNGTDYRIALASGQAPEIAGAAVTALMHLYAKEYLFMDHYETSYLNEPVDYVYNDNYDTLLAAEYEKAFNEPMPEDFYSLLFDANGNPTPLCDRYDQISAAVDEITQKAEQAYTEGVTVINGDGSFTHYDTYDQYLIASGNEIIGYEDYYATMRTWYEKKTGDSLTKEEIDAIHASYNVDLLRVYNGMHDQMEADYLAEARANGYSALMLYPDGAYKGYTNARYLEQMQALSYMTVTRRILYTLGDVQIDTADITVKTDKEGRIEKVEGVVSFLSTDVLGETHTLDITFTGEAFDYGTSTVEPFDPKAYGVVSSQEFFGGNYSVNDVDVIPAPLVTPEPLTHVTLFGIEYEVCPEGDIG